MALTWSSTVTTAGVAPETIRHSREAVIETEMRQLIGSPRRSRSPSGSGAPPYLLAGGGATLARRIGRENGPGLAFRRSLFPRSARAKAGFGPVASVASADVSA